MEIALVSKGKGKGKNLGRKGHGSATTVAAGCYYCGEESHWMKDCPWAQSSSSPSSSPASGSTAFPGLCFVCGHRGHRAAECSWRVKHALTIGEEPLQCESKVLGVETGAVPDEKEVHPQMIMEREVQPQWVLSLEVESSEEQQGGEIEPLTP